VYTEAVTPEGKLRFADYTWDAHRKRLIAVCESHEDATSDGATGVVNTVVAIGKPPSEASLGRTHRTVAQLSGLHTAIAVGQNSKPFQYQKLSI
jgi:hypothetical protein